MGLVGRGRKLAPGVKAARKCSVEGCTGRYKAKGLCATHYNRQLVGIPSTIPIEHKNVKKYCKMDGCNSLVLAKKLCKSHYRKRERRLKKVGKWVPDRPGQGRCHRRIALRMECKSEYCRHPAEDPGGYCSICDHMVRMGLPLDYRPNMKQCNHGRDGTCHTCRHIQKLNKRRYIPGA